jgi:hypothetical protein
MYRSAAIALYIVMSVLICFNLASAQGTVKKEKSAGRYLSDIDRIDKAIEKKQAAVLKLKKSDAMRYASLNDEIAELMISKINLLSEMDKFEDIDSEVVCDFALRYESVEFIKTQFYKTPFHDDVAKTLRYLAQLYTQCQPREAGKFLVSNLMIKENIYSKDSAEAAEALDLLADHHRFAMADFEKSIGLYRKAKGIREKLYGVHDPRTTGNNFRLAVSIFYHQDGKQEAEKLLLSSIDIRKNAPAHKDFSLFSAYMGMGIYYGMINAHSNGIHYLQKALDVFEGKLTSEYIMVLDELSLIYLDKDDFQKSLSYAKVALDKAKELYGDSAHPLVLQKARYVDEIRADMNQN